MLIGYAERYINRDRGRQTEIENLKREMGEAVCLGGVFGGGNFLCLIVGKSDNGT